jgi:hypothetical protein
VDGAPFVGAPDPVVGAGDACEEVTGRDGAPPRTADVQADSSSAAAVITASGIRVRRDGLVPVRVSGRFTSAGACVCMSEAYVFFGSRRSRG